MDPLDPAKAPRSRFQSFRASLIRTVATFSPFERLLFIILTVLFAGSAIINILAVNAAFTVQIPASGGTFTEGVVGSPRFINPLLATAGADRDLTELAYAGLMRPGPDGTLIPELAEGYTISEDGKVYEFRLKEGLTFHDGTPVTADDVIFSVERAQDPQLKSPWFVNWSGVTVRKLSPRDIAFELQAPYAPFIENTIMGILPKHIWEGVDADSFPFSQFNIEPVGAGPYRVAGIKRDEAGIPVSYELSAFEDYALGTPHVRTITLRLFSSETDALESLKKGGLDALGGLSPESARMLSQDKFQILTPTLPRVFGVFFNQNRAQIFAREEVREALTKALNRDQIIDASLEGYGMPISAPLPPLPEFAKYLPQETSTGTPESREDAAALLTARGWTRDESGVWVRGGDDPLRLSFTIATANVPELKAAAQSIAEQWNAFGAEVAVEFYEPSDLTTNVIRSRRYDALFFGEIIGRDLDLYAFWHSSQRNDPGLNIAMYANITADRQLETLRTERDPEKRDEALVQFLEEMEKDTPAVFTHAPQYIYATSPRIRNVTIEHVGEASERFSTVYDWFINTDRVWPIFTGSRDAANE